MVQLDSVNGPAAPFEITAAPIDPRRYRKLRFFLLRVLVHALWHDLVLNRPLLAWARRDPVPRWQEIARRYRSLAVEMGGVLIKLGQFLSIRVDLLPAEILYELAGLQDEVPPHPVQEIEAQIAAEYGRPVDQVFAGFSPVATGAASLAQVHHARLPSGQEVVVKVLRPGIEVLVETDLKAVDLALKYLKLSRMIRRRVDLDRLGEEFRRTTLRELDLVAEAASAERFGELFADEEKVRVPRVYPAASRRRVLVLEDVGFIKLADRAGLLAAGIDPAEVARTLYRIYMRQLFEHNFVHADPHPGNLFVEPLPTPEEREAGTVAFHPGERVLGHEASGDESPTGDTLKLVSFSSAMHSLIAVGAEGQLLTPSITWADSRAAKHAKRIKEEMDGHEIYLRTGTPIHAMSPLSKISSSGTTPAARMSCAMAAASLPRAVMTTGRPSSRPRSPSFSAS